MSSSIPREDLLAALRDLAADLGTPPTRTEMNDHGEYSHAPYYTEFGSWNDAVRAAGLGTNHENDISDETLIADLQRLAADLDRTPTFEDMDEHGEHAGSTYVRRFGSWPKAKEAAGLDPKTTTSRRTSREELIAAVRDLAGDLGKPPTQEEMNESGEFSHRPYYREFGSWADALEAAGYEPNHRNGIPKDDLIAELQSFAEELGYTPTMRDMRESGEYSPQPYLTTFGSWAAAWQEADLEFRHSNPGGWVPEKELLQAIHLLADSLGRPPTRPEMDHHGLYSREPYERAFGSWNDALQAAGFDPNKEHDIDSAELLDELQSLADQLGHTPSQAEMNEQGAYFSTTYETKFDSWNNAIKQAGLSVRKRVNIPEEDLLDDLRTVTDSLDHPPEPYEYKQSGKFSIEPFVRVFGSWKRALQAVGYEASETDGIGGRLNYYGPNWQEQREKALRRDGYVCQDCRMTNSEHYREYGQSLHMHHIRRFRGFDHYEEANRIVNLVTLCQSCHGKWEGTGEAPP